MATTFSDPINNINGYFFEAADYLAYRTGTRTAESPAIEVYLDFCIRGANVGMDGEEYFVTDHNADMPHADYISKAFHFMALARAAYHHGTLHFWFVKRLPELDGWYWEDDRVERAALDAFGYDVA